MLNRLVMISIICLFLSQTAVGQTKLCPGFSPWNPANDDDIIGATLDTSGDNIIVGNPGHDSLEGEVYIFKGTNGTHQKLTPSFASHLYGASVAIEEKLAIVGAPFQSGGGMVYMYYDTGNGYVPKQNLPYFGSNPHADFGHHIDVNGRTMIIDASGDRQIYTYVLSYGTSFSYAWQSTIDYPTDLSVVSELKYGNGFLFVGGYDTSGEGAVWVFSNSSYTFPLHQKLTGYTSTEDFGSSINITDDGEYLVVGAPSYVDNGDAVGAVYIYAYNAPSYVLDDFLLASDGMDLDTFGSSVAVEKDGYKLHVLVGTSLINAVYHYEITNSSTTETKITGGSGGNGFGLKVAIQDRDTAIIADLDESCYSWYTTGAIYYQGL